MSSFGVNSAADFFQKLRDERRDFVASHCLDARHAINAVMTGYHLCEWVFGENKSRPGFEHKDEGAFRAALEALPGSPIGDARKVTNGTKHFKLKKIETGKAKDAWGGTWGRTWGGSWGPSYLWLDRHKGRQRAEDFIDELIEFWDGFFKKHGLKQYADTVARSDTQLCGCGTPMIDFDKRGEMLTGCVRCNRWWPIAKPPIRLPEEDLHALSRARGAFSIEPENGP